LNQLFRVFGHPLLGSIETGAQDQKAVRHLSDKVLGHLIQRNDLVRQPGPHRTPRHAPDDRTLLVLHEHRSFLLLEVLEPLGAVFPHAGEDQA